MRIRTLRGAVSTGAVVLAAGLVLSACGSDSNSNSASSPAADKGSATVVTAGFTEIDILANIYEQLLEKQGYQVTIKTVADREQYLSQLEAGKEDIVPDYLGSAANFLYAQKTKNPDATTATADVTATQASLTGLAKAQGLTVLNPAQATDQNAYAVSQQYAKDNNLKTLSDLGASGKAVVIAAPAECKQRPLCGVGLEDTYKINITKYLPFPFGSATAKKQVTDGKAQLVQVSTTGTPVSDDGLVLLTDDKGLQPAENLIPIVGKGSPIATDTATIALINKFSSTLTTEDLATLNTKVDVDRERPADVAKDYLTSKGLI